MLKKWKGRRVRVKGDIKHHAIDRHPAVLLVIFMTITPLTPVGFRNNSRRNRRQTRNNALMTALSSLAWTPKGRLASNRRGRPGFFEYGVKNIFKTRNTRRHSCGGRGLTL